jgi:hypothetical protein
MGNDPKEKPEIKNPGSDRERAIPPDFVPEPKLPTPDPDQEEELPSIPETINKKNPH